MPTRCTRCKTGVGQVTLGKRALKCYKAKYPNCSADDLFCKKCNDYMEEIVAQEVARQKKRKLMERRLRMNLEGGRNTSSSSSAGRLSFQTIVERIAEAPPPVRPRTSPNSSGAQRQTSRQQEDVLTSPEIQYTQSQSQPTPRRDPLFGNLQDSSQSNSGDNQRRDPLFGNLQDSSQSNSGDNQRVEPVWHEYEEDIDERPICPIAGPSTSAAITQPIVRKRRTAVVFADERIIPIYNQRRDFGG